ncbi:MAG: hypothetical protein HY875_10115 [Chloroflexi bacterium]|nr:hypothetical protein [Chloroflexota bacterium]
MPTVEQIPARPHAHHWLIEEANGPLSTGVCKSCGERKDFRNWLLETDFITNEERRATAA